MLQPEIGEFAPDFSLETDQGQTFTLSRQVGAPVVLFFYPKDDTPGCTRENGEFSDLNSAFAAQGVTLLGISPDSVADHAKFRAKHALDVMLAADPQHRAISAYGVWGPKKMAGHEYIGLIRTTFLIGADGRIADKWQVFRTKGHAQKVLDAVVARAG